MGNVKMRGALASLTGLFLLLGKLSLFAQPTEPLWVTMPGSAAGGINTSVEAGGSATDFAGNTYVTGVFQGRATFGTNVLNTYSAYPDRDIYLVKYDPSGNVVWAQRAGGNYTDDARALAVDFQGNVFIAGLTTSDTTSFGTNAISGLPGALFVAKYTSSGECLWVRRAGPWLTGGSSTLNSTASFTLGGMAADNGGNVVLAGSFIGNPMFGGVLTNNSFPFNLTGGTILYNNNTNLNSGTQDIFLAKYDTTGSLLWAANHGATNSESANAVAVDPSGNIYVAGSFGTRTVLGNQTYTNNSQPSPLVAKFNATGEYVWSSPLTTSTNFHQGNAFAVNVTAGGQVTVAFRAYANTFSWPFGPVAVTNQESDPGFNPVWMSLLARLDANGAPVWLKKMPFHTPTFGTPGPTLTLAQDTLTNTYAAGYGNWNLSANVNASRGFTVVKYDVNGNTVWTNLVGRGVNVTAFYTGVRTLGLDSARNLYFAGTASGDKPTELPFGWTNVLNGFTNGFGNNLFVTKLANTFIPVAPQFVAQPTNMLFQPPGSLTNYATARAWPVSVYRWYMNSNGIVTRVGTNQLFYLPSTTVTNVTGYFVVASNAYGQATSDVVFAQPQLAILPNFGRTNLILLGGAGTLSINATGTTAITYQWRFNGTNINGATGPTLTLNGATTNTAGQYTVVACNGWGCLTSAPAITVKVIPPGSVDTTYTTSLTGDYGMTRLPDGRLLTAGTEGYGTQLYRALANGAYDTNFYLVPPALGGTYAWWRTGAFDSDGPRAFLVDPDGTLLVGGTFTHFYRDNTLGWTNVQKMVRLTANGNFDPSFYVGSGPRDNFDPGNNQSGIRALLRQTNGQYIAAGWFKTFNDLARVNIVRLNANGSVDTAFAAHTFAYGSDYNNVGQINALAFQADGKILAGGNWQRVDGQDRPVLLRLNADGTLDNSFAVMRRKDGSSTWPANGFCNVSAITVLPSGKILIAGNGLLFNQTGYDNRAIFQLNSDGTVDTNFVAQTTGGTTYSYSLAAQTDGKILLGGQGNVFRFLPTGALDPEWVFDPALTASSPGTSRILIEPSGSTALMAGSYGIRRILLKVDPGVPPTPSMPSGSAFHLPNGEFGFSVCGQAGQTLIIQASTNMVDWADISTNVVVNGCINFTDTQAPQIPNRFYRVLTLP